MRINDEVKVTTECAWKKKTGVAFILAGTAAALLQGFIKSPLLPSPVARGLLRVFATSGLATTLPDRFATRTRSPSSVYRTPTRVGLLQGNYK